MSSTSIINIESIEIQYRGWLITKQVVNGRLWLRWQHPQDSSPRYGYPVTSGSLASAISYVKFLINITIQLESETEELAMYA